MNKQELASTIWSAANELRRNISASEYKNYILGFMFYKYLSDKELQFLKENGATVDDLGNDEDHYFRNHNGYFIAKDDLFDSWLKAGQKLGAQMVSDAIERFYQNLNEKYARCFYVYNKEVNKHSGVFDALDSGLSKLGENAGSRDKAVRGIVGIVAKIPAKSKEYDVLGYIYEYLIKQFSSEAKKDGAFYTPHELTKMMAKITADRVKGKKEVTVYDPCLGTAGLLLNIGDEVGKYVTQDNIHYYGQELITETSNLAKMNLFMADIPVQNMVVRNADTLEDDWPYFDENTPYKPMMVDIAVANPPYSIDWNPSEHTNDERFRGYGLAPAGKADYAFLLHCLFHLKKDGVMAIVLPHGVLFRGDQEEVIRTNLIKNHNIETIIGMPDHLFFSTGIPVIVMILSKNRTNSDVLFIDASQNYEKGKNQNVLRDADVERIVDAVKQRKDVPNFARVVSQKEIEDNGYNLNIPRYISAKPEETPYDLYSVMSGAVSQKELAKFENFQAEFGNEIRNKIFETDDMHGYLKFRKDVDISDIVTTDKAVKNAQIAWDKDIDQFCISTFNDLLNTINQGHRTVDFVETAKDKIFEMCKNYPLVDPYNVYQAFCDNWTLIDSDLSRILSEGTQIISEKEPKYIVKKDTKTKLYSEVPAGEEGKIIPVELIREVCYYPDRMQIEDFKDNIEEAESEANDLFDGLSEDEKEIVAKDETLETYDPKKVASVCKKNKDAVSKDLFKLNSDINAIKESRKRLKDYEKNLQEKSFKTYSVLDKNLIEQLLTRKWMDPMNQAMSNVFSNVISSLVKDLEALQKKYANPLGEVQEESAKVGSDLSEMMKRLHGTASDDKAIEMLRNQCV